jgi:glycosyltransferase involved in cell wall biosynthesis
MEIRSKQVVAPFFSICIPQYNRTSFLIEACKSLCEQTFSDFEVCISDDCSTDGREGDLLAFLEQSGMSFVYRKQERNTRYDGNIRASIALARGRYCFLLGNDDALASPATLQQLHDDLEDHGFPAVAIANYEEFASGKPYRRVGSTGPMGAGPQVAASRFRDFSFVSGVILDRAKAQAQHTAKWDGSEMYQMFVGCRMLAEGGALLGIERIAVRKDIQIPGESVDSYAKRPRDKRFTIVERKLPLGQLGRLVVDAIEPFVGAAERQRLTVKVFWQILVFTYPFWLFEYRRVQSWKYAAGIALGMRPRNLLGDISLNSLNRLRIILVYAAITASGLSMPVNVFQRLYPVLYRLAKA